MSALCADLITRGDLNNNDLGRNVAGLWHPVDNAVLFWRPREIPVREEKAAKKGVHFEEVRARTQMYAAQHPLCSLYSIYHHRFLVQQAKRLCDKSENNKLKMKFCLFNFTLSFTQLRNTNRGYHTVTHKYMYILTGTS